MLSGEEYERLAGHRPDFKDYLLTGEAFEGLDLTRDPDRVARVATELAAAGVEVAAFIDPDQGRLPAVAGSPRERATCPMALFKSIAICMKNSDPCTSASAL